MFILPHSEFGPWFEFTSERRTPLWLGEETDEIVPDGPLRRKIIFENPRKRLDHQAGNLSGTYPFSMLPWIFQEKKVR